MAKRILVVIIVFGALIGGLTWMLQREAENVTGDLPNEGSLRVVSTTTMVTDMVRVVGGIAFLCKA